MSQRKPYNHAKQKPKETFTFFKLVDMLDEGVDDETALVNLAIKNGLRLTPEEAVELIFYDTGAERAILRAVKDELTPEQQAQVDEFLAS